MRTLALILALLLAGCTQLFLQPDRELVLHPSKLGLDYEDIFLPTPDGERTHGWYLPAKGTAKGTILHLHGNAENISTFIAQMFWLPSEGYNVFMLDYGGYGQSEGVATIHRVHADALRAMSWLLERPGADSEQLFVLGQSLGGSVALHAVAHHPRRERVRAVIVEGAFSSYSRIAREKMAKLWLTWPLQWPLSLLFSDTFSADRSVEKLGHVPVLFIHGGDDDVVAPHHSRILFEAKDGPKERWVVERGRHIDALKRLDYRRRLLEYLEAVGEPLADDHGRR